MWFYNLIHFVIMFKIKDTVYADAGFILLGSNKRGYQFKGETSEFKEKRITLDDMRIEGNLVCYGEVVQSLPNVVDYPTLKADMVKKRYSIDDQIAIMLNTTNSEDDKLRFDKMQEWREWSEQVAKKILEVI